MYTLTCCYFQNYTYPDHTVNNDYAYTVAVLKMKSHVDTIWNDWIGPCNRCQCLSNIDIVDEIKSSDVSRECR
ncbi:unnamed protein product [Schistosoma mattheei]|uniref:Uncharacterized protein n=1 Tax=Schistosoma mattheei TaxID=31246 RepID=A0AA85AZ41_9TREM|nr:unnamed protein product [Schistosoma mattheei]